MHRILEVWQYIDGIVQDCSISSANVLEILQSCTKPLISTGTCNMVGRPGYSPADISLFIMGAWSLRFIEAEWRISKLTIIGSDNGLLPGRHQAIIWTNAGMLLIESLGTNFSEIWLVLLSTYLAGSTGGGGLSTSCVKWSPTKCWATGFCCSRPRESAFHTTTPPDWKYIDKNIRTYFTAQI